MPTPEKSKKSKIKLGPTSSIEEVNSALEFKERPPSRMWGIILWLITFVFWGVGLYVIVSALLHVETGAIALIGSLVLPVISENIQFIVIVASLLALISLIGGFFLLKLIHKGAREVTLLVFGGLPILFLILGVIVFVLTETFVPSLIFIAIGGGGIVLFIVFKERLEIVGRALELSAEAIVDEPGQLLATFISAILGFWTAISWALTLAAVWGWMTPLVADTRILYVIEIVLSFFGFWILMFQKYFWDAVIVGIVHNWYRSPSVDVASFGRSFSRASHVMGGIVSFAFVMSILRALVATARKGKGLSARIIAGMLGIAASIIRFLGFFALPAIVIRNTGFKKGFKDSVNKLRDLFIEVLASAFGFGLVLAVFALIISIFYGGIGYFLGAYFFATILGGVTAPNVLLGLVSAIGFWIIGLIPTSLIFSTLTTTFNTILYEFGVDLEFGEQGIELPKRLPEELKNYFTEKLKEEGHTVPAVL
ncbi:MAG: CTL/SLC44 family protein [Candidatus Korarchaeota archaeon]|nr:CTL/SLC44 family protein [Candidatus Korarchaeota archaeon]NIU81891.1 hypothetical protein [Candidatus Thorarchaeota archaeon]NIW12344.1 hypothetical protein [Candidatus Thorarchaeota archaeon]NIW50621.1 hypothetical protein [Candidatus Korarchaeota archaeon]